MAKPTITVRLAPGTAGMVPDYEALADGVMRFHGRVLDRTRGHRHPTTGVMSGEFVAHDREIVLPQRREYRDEIRAGVLIPCDAATAAYAGVQLPKVSA